MKAEIYSKANCGFCDKAKKLLDQKGIEYTEINAVEHRDALIERVTADTGKSPRSVPQIYLEGVYIGGHQELVEYVVSNPELFGDHAEVVEGMKVVVTKDAIDEAAQHGIDLMAEVRKAVADEAEREREASKDE